MRDMIPRNDRSIRNIPVSTNHRRVAPPPRVEEVDEVEIEEENDVEMPPLRPVRRSRPRRRSKLLIIAAVVVVIVGTVLALLLSTMFAGATVTVFPRKETVAPPSTIVARMNAPVGALSYQTMTLSRGSTTTVPATGTKQVSRQASGLMTIYNTYDTSPQRLIANTRFEAPDGKMYRIHESVVVPGMTGATPGSISITVYADSPGAEYNRGTTRFTIPGFKGDPRYEKFYAEAQSVSGGFVGAEPSVAAADLTAARTTLERALQSGVQSAILSEIPEGHLPLPTTLRIVYSAVTQTPGAGSNATLSQTAQATVAIVRANDLASMLAKDTVQGYTGEAVMFEDPSQISISSATSTATDGSLTLQIVGSPTLVWQYDREALVSQLLGKNKGTFQQIIQSFEPAIMRAEAKIRPFWKSAFPSEPERIEVETGEES